MHNLIVFLLIIIICSCESKAQKKSTIFIHNTTVIKIDSVRITSYGLSFLFNEILPGKVVEKNISINYPEKYEGAFLLSLYVNDSVKNQTTFGYYSSVEDIKSYYRLEVYDNFKIKEKNRELKN